MKNLGMIFILMATMALTGCLDSGSGKEVPSNLNNEDFEVVTDPETENGGQSGGGTTNPDEENPSTPSQPSTPDGLEINKGETLTASTNLLLDFYPPYHSAYAKVSENDNCADGVWENYADSRSLVSSKTNQNVPVSVQFRDHDGRTSECYVKRIFIDQTGPEIVFAKYPVAPVEEGLDVEIVFSVTDPGAGVAEVTCQFGPISKACAAGQNKIIFPKMAGGDYTLNVSAKDKLGQASQKSVSFKVSSLYKQMAQNVKVNEYQKVDILFVIDNSGSMAYEQKSMASRVRNFLDVVKGLDWQIAVTTTDPENKTLGDGRLVPLYGRTGSYILNSSVADSEARTILGNTLQRSETGSGSEQGIYTAYRAVERSLAASGGNVNFIRSDAQLAVVLISDEDESANGLKNDPANFVKFIQSSFNGQKAMSFHSIIARPGDKACLSGEGYSAGFRYEAISKLTGGVIGDVCATDYAAQVQGIAEGVRNTLKSITLSCAPVIDSMRSLLVLKDGQVYDGTRTVQGLNVVFDQMLPAGNYEVLYSCLK
ncbi:hypothetical protein QJS83_06425 [Bdellovibrio sp. 22V]|uniref:hypothetical protein n=1 Tax=Bdellovibrio sp. 22V TaxID=3044166 RepID=UPI0025434C51|nr:hypothetical protein [Bdellovibrio sp. 22V]WII73505.1 hypothetical protein QJS83_06425 [Bdellovibrio sp. 22V]